MRNIEKRIDQDIAINEDLFSCALVDVTDFLCDSLKDFMTKENRYLGIVKSYMSSLDNAYERFNEDLTSDDEEIYGKVLYLLKPIILREFTRLRNKKLSDGDCVILMIRKLLSIVSETPEFSRARVVKTISKIFDKLFDNIKNRAKKDSMYNFTNQIKGLKLSGSIGKYALDRLDLSAPKKEKTLMIGDSILIDDTNHQIVTIDLAV